METLLAIASLGQRAYGRWLFQRLLSGIIVVVGLTIIVSIMIGAILIGALYGVYSVLSQYGATPAMAMIITGFTAMLITGMLVMFALLNLHHLRRMPQTLLKESPITSQLMDTLNAFTDGLMAEKSNQ